MARTTTTRTTTARKTAASSASTPAEAEPMDAPPAPPLTNPPVAIDAAPVPVAQTVADPAPLGLAGFALTTFLLSIANTHVWPEAAGAAVYTAIAYGGLAQLLAGMWEYKRGNTFGATAFGSYGAFWIAVFFLVQVGGAIPGLPETAFVFGPFLLAWGIFTMYMTVASLRVSAAVFVVFALLTLAFFLLSIGAFETSTGWTKVGGWVGVATAAAAWYASFAGVTNETFKRVVIPTGTILRG